MKPTTLLWCAVVVTACASTTAPDAAHDQRLAQARRLVAADPEAALRITDELLATTPNWAAARVVAGEGSLRLARLGSSARADLLLQDAVRNLKLGLADEDTDAATPQPTAWLQLAECYHELGDWGPAATAASRAAAGFDAAQPAAPRRAADARLLAGKALFREFVALRQPERESGEANRLGIVPAGKATVAAANAAAVALDAARPVHPAEACLLLADIHRWLDQRDAVIAEYERGIRTSPNEPAIHDAYIEWMIQNGQRDALGGAYTRFVRENGKTPILRWHQGRALARRADFLRADGNFAAAIAGYDKAKAAFTEYLAAVPAHQQEVGQWLATCELSAARTAVELGDLAQAQRRLFAADDASPLTSAVDEAGAPRLRDAFGEQFTTVVFAIHRATAEIAKDPLRDTLAFNEAVLARHPQRWGWVHNNAALAARDLGVQLAQRGQEAEARQLWQRSYELYEQAAALSPDDARIANDCGLMLIYHLHRDYDQAKRRFERAIAIGQAQLDALPTDTDQRERERLEEAVGDAWQNLAVLAQQIEKQPFAAYEQFCRNAVRYYPYQRREAAAMLRTAGANDLKSTQRSASDFAADATAPVAAAQGGAQEAFEKAQKEARTKAAAEDFDGALAALDAVAKACAAYAPYHAYKGELNLALARQALAQGRKGVDFFFQDAIRAYRKAVELDPEPVGPRLLLSQAQYEGNDLEGAAQTCSQLLLHMQSQGGGKPDDVLAVHTTRANAAARAFAAAKQNGGDGAELLTAARASFRLLEQQDRLDATLRGLWSVTEQWAGAPAEAVNVYVRALAKAPDDQALMKLVVDTAFAQNQLQLAVDAFANRDDATALWYRGWAGFLLGDTERADAKKALQLLDDAMAAFTQSMQKNAGYKDSCEQWLAMCLGKKGNIAFFAKDLANAEQWLFEGLRMRPALLETDLGLSESIKLGILRVADSHFKANNLGKVEAIYRIASDLASQDADLQNNSGLFARDWGNVLERDGKQKEAMGMYEQSYKAYSRALELTPDSVRLRNDCALIAIYHLDRDWELSKKRLDSAIADGEKVLRDSPPDDRQERQQLEEAVGDCYENLALWHLKHSKDGAAAKAAAEASAKYYPGARRPGARRHLQAAERLLQGK
jgi:tetratricopeptide (TPR) repeat protein